MEKKDILLVGNWKSNPGTVKEAETLLRFASKIKKQKGVAQIICPPTIFLSLGKKYKKTSFLLGAQDIGASGTGPHTGDVSGEMLRDMKVPYVIVGHSERRALGETSELVSKKVSQCLSAGIIPILCVGESVRDESHAYLGFIAEQLKNSLAGVPKAKISNVIIAYEPIWAIGAQATREATPEEFREMSIYIRKVLSDAYGSAIGKMVRIIYGGSANEKDAADFVVHGGAQGFLVGRVSLIPKRWGKMIEVCGRVITG